MERRRSRKLEVLLAGAIAGLFLGPLFFDESGAVSAYALSAIAGAFVAVVIYEIVSRRRR